MLLGPTASGKTALAMALYDALGGAEHARLISVDSALVYRGMDIGTAKPTPTEQQRYPHSLIDLRDPAEPYSAADFVTDADAEVAAAQKLGQVPILVGGTMLYAKSFLQGLAELPHADAEVRAALEAEFDARGAKAMHAELTAYDPKAAANIEPANRQRLLRAMEVYRLTGQPMSVLWQDQADVSVAKRLGSDVLTFALVPDDRSLLHERIEQRFDAMLNEGFLAEAESFYKRGDLHADLPSMRAVGYRQAWQHLAGEIDHARFVADAKTATRRLAKRQLTWLRSWPDLESLTTADFPTAACEQILAKLQPGDV